jgi:hypothetical protein
LARRQDRKRRSAASLSPEPAQTFAAETPYFERIETPVLFVGYVRVEALSRR